MKRLIVSILAMATVGSGAAAQTAPHIRLAISTAAMAVNQGPPGGPGGRRFQGPTEEEKERNRVRIGITKDQQGQIDQVFRDSDQQMQDIRKKFSDLSKQLYTLYDSYDFDRTQAQTIRRDLLRLHKRMAEIHAENEEKLRKIMNREQFERMRAIIREDMENRRKQWEEMRKRGGQPPRPGG